MYADPVAIFSNHYDIRVMGLEKLHPFDSCKYGRAWEKLRSDNPLIARDRSLIPEPVTREDLLLVHTEGYLEELKSTVYLARALEVPVVRWLPWKTVDSHVLLPMRYATGGTILAAEQALERGIAVNFSGGYHHASRDRGEGFCIYADVAIAIAKLRQAGKIQSALIVDLDAHQGNGFERIFLDDPAVAIFDMYNASVYPRDQAARKGIRWEIQLPDWCADKEYLDLLRRQLPAALDEVRPDIAFYNAGTDILVGDPLGCLAVSEQGVLERDRLVFTELTRRGIPWVMVPSGGYTKTSYQLIAESVQLFFALLAKNESAN